MNTGPAALWLVRHGESEGNVARARAYADRTDDIDISVTDSVVGLSATGRAQATSVGHWIAAQPPGRRPTAVVVSSYRRAEETAERMLAAAGLSGLPRRADERLRDREQGALDRLTASGIERRYPEEVSRRRFVGKFYYRPPGGESWADVAQRVRAALLDIRLELAAEKVLVVTHDVPILLVRYVLEALSVEEVLGFSGRLANCALTRYERDNDGALRLECFNDLAPLRADDQPVTSGG